MSNPIPPLVCDTPPPIDDDFEPYDDDFGAFEGADGDSISPREEKSSPLDVKFELPVPEIPVVVEPPEIEVPLQREDPVGECVESPQNTVEVEALVETQVKSQEKVIVAEENSAVQKELRLGEELVGKRCESPPSLVLSEDFSCSVEDAPAEENSNSCDEISLPSFHLDSGGASKSVTPTQLHVPDNTDTFVISDDKVGHSDVDDDEKFDDFVEFASSSAELQRTDADGEAAASPITQEDNQESEEDDFEPYTSAKPESSIPCEEVIDFVADFSQFSAPPAEISVVSQTVDNQGDDEDEFGDFSDFQQPDAATEAVIDTTNLDSQFLSALNLMFPKGEEDPAEENTKIDTEFTQKSQILQELIDFEASKALQYQWLNSTSNQFLIRSLGIDSRNILHGGKWNSSMPRFAANLGFSPLQPQKQGSGASTSGAPQQRGEGSEKSVSSMPSEVPAAQFDWTSSGLVNPLDGAPKVLPKSDDAKDTKEQPEPPPAATSTVATATAGDIQQPVDIDVAKEVSSTRVPPPNVLPQPFSQPLRETHIFTPSKSSNPVSREVSEHATSTESKIVVKEYRDVEYNPDKVVRVDDDFSDFTEFKSSPGQEDVVESAATKIPPTESPYRATEKVVEFTKPTFGVSPTEEMVNGMVRGVQNEEDEFCDFQSVKPAQQHSTNTQPMAPVLQPLNVMQLAGGGPKIAWPSPGINPDEMARLEAIYPQKKDEKVAVIEPKGTEKKNREEDEWSDFVSGNAAASRDDDWTDFMSGGAPAQKSLQQGPNFSSWSTPQLPPPQFTAWHHSNIFTQPQFFSTGIGSSAGKQVTNNNHLAKGPNNGQINGFPLINPLATISSGNPGRRAPKDTSGISVIPDMSFRAPKSIINLPRSSFTKK